MIWYNSLFLGIYSSLNFSKHYACKICTQHSNKDREHLITSKVSSWYYKVNVFFLFPVPEKQCSISYLYDFSLYLLLYEWHYTMYNLCIWLCWHCIVHLRFSHIAECSGSNSFLVQGRILCYVYLLPDDDHLEWFQFVVAKTIINIFININNININSINTFFSAREYIFFHSLCPWLKLTCSWYMEF